MHLIPTAAEVIDITPTPRILRTLGDIPFEPWQCLAELIDNSLDAFMADIDKPKVSADGNRIDIHWSSEAVAGHKREITIEDNGPGMPLDVLQKAAKAGYSSNNPIDNLGLFGMGFNIATARLGDETHLLSATADSQEWIGIEINFDALIKQGAFSARVIRSPKTNPEESGTRIVIRQLKDGIYSEIRRRESAIRQRLETIYSPILKDSAVAICVQGKQLRPRMHCVWDAHRSVVRSGVSVSAIQYIDQNLGDSLFDVSRNRYLSDDEAADYRYGSSAYGEVELPAHIVQRERRLHGWIGIQRFSDTTSFGLDFIRNGRKILIGDKSLFNFENPDTGSTRIEYPIELGSTVGGRIVGELTVDYLIPTYQKNGFNTNDTSWQLTVDAIRGAGPLLPKQRTALGYPTANDSPLGRLANAYRRVDPGTRNLALPNHLAQDYAKKFFAGDPEYQDDDKWFRVAQEADRDRGEKSGNATPDHGQMASDNAADYFSDHGAEQQTADTVTESPSTDPAGTRSIAEHTSSIALLKANATRNDTMSHEYRYNDNPGFDVKVWRVVKGPIRVAGREVPCQIHQDGVEIDFFYDMSHPILAEYPLTPKQLLLQHLAEKFSLRDRTVSSQQVFQALVGLHMSDERINGATLVERANAIISRILDHLPTLLQGAVSTVVQLIESAPLEKERFLDRLLAEAPALVVPYQQGKSNAIQALAYVDPSTLKRLVSELPEYFMDGKLFSLPYLELQDADVDMLNRLRRSSVDRVVAYLSDVVSFTQGASANVSKHELMRMSHTLALLEVFLSK